MIDDIVKKKFLPMLQEQGGLSQSDLLKISKESESFKEDYVATLVKGKYVTDLEIESFLQNELGVKVVDPLKVKINQETLKYIPKQIAEKYNVVPLEYKNGLLSVALMNPMDIIKIDDLRAVLNLDLKPYLALSFKLAEAYKKNYLEEEDVEDDLNVEDIIAEAACDDLEVVENHQLGDVGDLLHSADETPIIKVTNLLLTEGIRRRASDIFIEPWEKHMSVRCRVDGLLEELKAPPKSMASSISSRIKVLSNLDIAERRIPQDGRFKIKFQKRFVDFRVSVLPSSFGEKICLRILDKGSQAQALEKLGFDELELSRIKDAASKPHGMILVTGPTGSGKTTTLYSVLAHIDSPEINITTVEDPVEYQVYGINQVQIKDSVGMSFPAALRSILRQDPDIIMVGEIRDYPTMDIAIKSALTGHLVLSTLHTNDACGSIIRITNMGIEPFLISSSILMVSAQRLIRRLCPECKEAYSPDKKVFEQISRKPESGVSFFRAVGCDACRNTGYVGRTVITEVLPLSQAIEDLVMKGATAEIIKKTARLEGMTTLRECGIKKVYQGDSSIDEVFRVTASDQPLD